MVQWLRLCLPMQGAQLRSLVGELRSHMLRSVAKKKKKKKKVHFRGDVLTSPRNFPQMGGVYQILWHTCVILRHLDDT